MNDNTLLIEAILVFLFFLIIFFLELLQASFDNLSLNALKNKFNDEDIANNKKISSLLKLLENPLRYLYTNKLVRIICWIAIGYVGIGVLYHELITITSVSPIVIILVGILVLFFVIALFVYFPRKLALQHSMNIGIKCAGAQNFICILFAPFREFIMLITNLFLKIFGQRTKVENTTFYEEDVMSMLEVGQKSGAIKEEGKKMIDSIFAFDDKLAYEIMTPRTDVFTIDVNASYKDYIDKLMELTYTRIPVYENEVDNIIGILNIKDYLIEAKDRNFDKIKIRSLLREPYMVPETKNIDSLFLELQKSKQQVAVLIDEYGGFSGIVTIEDIVEEIVGEIDDEYDQEDTESIKKVGENEYLIEGNTDLSEINQELGTDIQSETSETISGFLIDELGEFPEEGTKPTVKFKNYEFLILEMDERRISKLKMTISKEDDGVIDKKINEESV